MVSLLNIHIVAFFIVFANLLLFSKNTTNDLGSKYFFTNYIYHNHKCISCFIITYPFVLILIYFIFADVFPIGSFFMSIFYVYFLYEIISKKNIVKKEEYIYWYKKNVKHSFSMHAYDKIKKNFNFLNERINRAFLFKFEIILFIALVIESEVMLEVISMIDKIK